ncbi:hypothetical protein JHW43_002509 [Diplocarpon mali]|nr:hypothetical protein JHW43_002509 [Diplocarpon mali]
MWSEAPALLDYRYDVLSLSPPPGLSPPDPNPMQVTGIVPASHDRRPGNALFPPSNGSPSIAGLFRLEEMKIGGSSWKVKAPSRNSCRLQSVSALREGPMERKPDELAWAGPKVDLGHRQRRRLRSPTQGPWIRLTGSHFGSSHPSLSPFDLGPLLFLALARILASDLLGRPRRAPAKFNRGQDSGRILASRSPSVVVGSGAVRVAMIAARVQIREAPSLVTAGFFVVLSTDRTQPPNLASAIQTGRRGGHLHQHSSSRQPNGGGAEADGPSGREMLCSQTTRINLSLGRWPDGVELAKRITEFKTRITDTQNNILGGDGDGDGEYRNKAGGGVEALASRSPSQAILILILISTGFLNPVWSSRTILGALLRPTRSLRGGKGGSQVDQT